MITRYCFIRLTADHATDLGRADALADAAHLATIPGLTVTCGVPADASAASWDLAITASAATLSDLATAMSSPAWSLFFDDYLTTRAVVVKAWNFSVG